MQQDPIVRNLIETMGVFMPIDLPSKSPAEGLFRVQRRDPRPAAGREPVGAPGAAEWPEDVFGKIDREKAKAGKALFMTHCSGCHNAWPYTWTEPNKYGKRFVLVGLMPQTYVGTDPQQFDDLRPFALTGQLGKYLPGRLRGQADRCRRAISTSALHACDSRNGTRELKLTEARRPISTAIESIPLPTPPERVYKAAPRDGVWATPPFMHNGSVPNLYEMLIPAKERTKKFYVGREFDPVKVGLDTSGASGKFLLDTTLLGNSNAGHSFEDGPRGERRHRTVADGR